MSEFLAIYTFLRDDDSINVNSDMRDVFARLENQGFDAAAALQELVFIDEQFSIFSTIEAVCDFAKSNAVTTCESLLSRIRFDHPEAFESAYKICMQEGRELAEVAGGRFSITKSQLPTSFKNKSQATRRELSDMPGIDLSALPDNVFADSAKDSSASRNDLKTVQDKQVPSRRSGNIDDKSLEPVKDDIRADLNAASERLSPIVEAARGGNADAKAEFATLDPGMLGSTEQRGGIEHSERVQIVDDVRVALRELGGRVDVSEALRSIDRIAETMTREREAREERIFMLRSDIREAEAAGREDVVAEARRYGITDLADAKQAAEVVRQELISKGEGEAALKALKDLDKINVYVTREIEAFDEARYLRRDERIRRLEVREDEAVGDAERIGTAREFRFLNDNEILDDRGLEPRRDVIAGEGQSAADRIGIAREGRFVNDNEILDDRGL